MTAVSMMTLPSHMTGFLHELGPSSGVYSYVSYPSTILPHTPRAKYRNELQGSASFNSPNANLMQNKRVVRGNTYAQRVPIRSFNVSSTLEDRDFHGTPGTPGLMQRKFHQRNQLLPNLANGDIQLTGWRPGTSATDRASTSHSLMRGSYLQSPSVSREGISIISPSARRTAARARARKRISSKLGDNDGYYSNGRGADTRDGLQHQTIQTDLWLEEIKGRVPEADAAVQTDTPPAISRPVTPTKNRITYERAPDPVQNVDKSTQILPDDPDLFVFNDEVVAVLETLVGKTLEQSLLEVIEEEELAAITRQKLSFRNKSLVVQHSS